jgi:hypothetical protein
VLVRLVKVVITKVVGSSLLISYLIDFHSTDEEQFMTVFPRDYIDIISLANVTSSIFGHVQ